MEETTQEVPEIWLGDFTYGDKPLDEWETELTVMLPRLPAQAQEISNCLVSLNNKFQLAYNCLSELEVVCNAKERLLAAAKYNVISVKCEEFKEKGVRAPGKDVLESIALSDTRCKTLYEDLQMYQLILRFFENHKTKLERVRDICIAIQYSVKNSDKMHDVGARQ